MERKLAAILSSDAKGYSRLMGEDEIGTVQTLTACRTLMAALIQEHQGRVVDSPGDNLLAEFASVVEAVRCAVAIQRELRVRNAVLPLHRRMEFRIGINLGDVIEEGQRIYGDCVNIAARLESLAEAGELCISGTAFDHVKNKLALDYEDLGSQSVKNIAEPVRVYRVRTEPGQVSPASRVVHAAHRLAARWRHRQALVLLALLLVVASVLWQSSVPRMAPGTFPDPATQGAPRLSLVVLPFENLSGDTSQEYYADGLTEDLTTDLASMPGTFVIARTSAFGYKGRPIDVKKVGAELGVRYAVEGSLRKIDDVLRVNVQLIATESGAHLWSDRFDLAIKELAQGQGQEDIVRRIATTLNVKIVDLESARSSRERPTNPDAFDLILRAWALHAQPPSRQREHHMRELYESALQLDPSSTIAMLGIANTIINQSLGFLGQWVTADELARADALVKQARAISPNAEAVLENVALLHQAHDQWEETAAAATRLIEAYPNNAGGYELLATAKRYTGHADEAIALYDSAIRLNPRSPSIFQLYGFKSFALLQVGRYDEAVDWAERSLAANPEAPTPVRSARYRTKAVAHALAGHIDDAREALATANKLWPFSTVRSNAPENFASPAFVAWVQDKYWVGARLAGLRDHADEEADFNVPAKRELNGTLAGWTPTTVPGATTVRTSELPALLQKYRPVVVDTVTHPAGRSIPGAIGLKHAGSGGTFGDSAEEHLRRKFLDLTGSSLERPIVVVGYNAERFDGYNLALRLVNLGYAHVYWYRGGREAWEVAGLPETTLNVEDW
ncbi:TolB amino-terminal domain-containing protein [Variovorax sp. HW608]|uniref:adenylate/guanylate cyclase domain-containing protein n=1 Tax=Variovorax sp. HW608 TaxID=1034889 RepID=UPI00081FDB7B|nr:tetratricopeptide repeat protein [Variovorax sp. HW608]SCK33354.1 TolB amino-terminal domain-containing protein [Variovorax sp. HW608]